MENINASAHTNHTRFWVERYKALRLNTQHNGQLIPVPCTLCYCPPDDCGMEELLEAQQAVDDILVNSTDSGNYQDQTLEDGINNIISEMEEPDCPKEIAGLYNSTYRLVLKDMIDQEITASELTEIISTAMLCPSEFGDVVFWARGILSKRSESYTYNDLDCESVNAEIDLREKANLAIDKSEIIITPNPAINHFRLENRSSFKTLNVRINDLDGNLFGQEILEDKIEIDCSEFTEGLYIVSISHQSGYNTIKRIIVIN